MALFSRRKKTDDASSESQTPIQADAADEIAEAAQPPSEPVPEVSISVQAFRGVGADAGPEVALAEEESETESEPVERPNLPSGPALPTDGDVVPRLPLAPALPPEQTHTVEGLIDNVLLRVSLAEIEEGAANDKLIGVMRQSLQGHLYLRVAGDAREQMAAGKPLSVGVIRDGDRSFMLAYSSGAALQASVQGEEDAASTSAIAQPTTSVYQQVITGGFTGIIIDNSSGPHRVVFPTELLQKALEEGDPEMSVKTILAAPRDEQTPVKVAEALAKVRSYVAINDGANGQPVGIAEAHTTDGRRFLQIFSHPLEVVALGRNDKPMPFEPGQLATVLSDHTEIAGILVNIAGPSIAIERDDLSALLVLAVDLGED